MPVWRGLRRTASILDESYDVTFSGTDFYLTSWSDGHTHIYRYGFDPYAAIPGGPAPNAAPLAHLVKQITSGDFEVEAIKSFNENSQALYYVSNEGDPLQQQVWAIKTDGTGKRQLSNDAGIS